MRVWRQESTAGLAARAIEFAAENAYNLLMVHEQLVATWISFMGTAIRNAVGLSRTQFVTLAQKYRLIPFLADNYELLHYYDNSYIVHDVLRYISEQGGRVDELSAVT
jgi:hypothetical protein